MASSNIKLFDENKGNMLTDTEFNISTQRLNGLQTGVASSQLQNKAMYQASLVAYAIAQVMMQNGLNANDTDAVSAFVANLSGTMLQKVYDIATTAEAQAGTATGKWMSPALVKAAIDKTLTDKNYLPKSGGTMTGNLTLNANPTTNLGAATKQYVDSAQSACLLKSGGTMTGNLILNANPSANLGAATKQYVDAAASNLQASINSVRSDLTPAFGNLAKNGYYKFGDMSVYNSGTYFAFRCYNFHTFLNNNFANLSEIAIVIKNSKWTNSSSNNAYLKLNGTDLALFGPKVTRTVNIIRRFPVYYVEYDEKNTYYYFITGDSARFQIDNDSLSFSISPQSNIITTTASTIGKAEVWYK